MKESLLYTDGEDDHNDTMINILGKTYNLHPVRATYAIKVGLLTSITALITVLFNLDQDRWMVYTVFSITEFCSEHCKVKSKERMQGTIIGAFIVIFIKKYGRTPHPQPKAGWG